MPGKPSLSGLSSVKNLQLLFFLNSQRSTRVQPPARQFEGAEIRTFLPEIQPRFRRLPDRTALALGKSNPDVGYALSPAVCQRHNPVHPGFLWVG